MVVVDFFSFASSRYKERYIKEAAIELDDVLLQMPPGKIFDLSLAISALMCFIGMATLGIVSSEWSWGKGIFIGGICGGFAFPVPRLFLKHLRKQRMAKFNEQLEDALSSISSSLKAGFSINQALEGVADENKNPISVEFRLLVQEIHLGVQMDEALQNMVNRLDSPDFELVAIAVITARQTGGELTSVLDRLNRVIRERMRINRRLAALTAQGRMQAYIIAAMPFILLAVMFYITPDMMSGFFHATVSGFIPIGILLLLASVAMVVAGFFVIKKITTIDI
jgi:tight adherence protein B